MSITRTTQAHSQTELCEEEVSKVHEQYEVPQNFKTHATCHLSDQIRMFGAESKSYNAAIGEKFHQVAVSGAMKVQRRVG